jgi:arsenate reductase (glutaredoxin)
VREQPPSVAELKLACDSLGIKKLFNSSGMDYRSMGLKDILPTLSESETLKLLSENGNLVKRPLVIADHGVMNGFNEAAWAAFFKI